MNPNTYTAAQFEQDLGTKKLTRVQLQNLERQLNRYGHALATMNDEALKDVSYDDKDPYEYCQRRLKNHLMKCFFLGIVVKKCSWNTWIIKEDENAHLLFSELHEQLLLQLNEKMAATRLMRKSKAKQAALDDIDARVAALKHINVEVRLRSDELAYEFVNEWNYYNVVMGYM
jgi:hypothetical protein